MSRVLVTFSAQIKPLQRPALVANGYGGVRYKDSGAYKEYKAALRMACELELPAFWTPYDKPTEIRIVCQYERPKSRPKAEWKDTVPDHENLLKPIQDALTGLVYTDDKTVCFSRFAKVYGDENRVTVQIRTLDGMEETIGGLFFDPHTLDAE